MNKRTVLVIAGASGVGKTTVAARLLSDFSDFGFVRSVTTRAPRGDSHDSEYIYTDREGFLERVERAEFVEYMEYGSNMYGTPLSELNRIFDEGRIPLLILDIEGVKSLRRLPFDFEAVIVYVWDDLNVVERRLYARDLASPSVEKLEAFIKRKQMNIRDYLSMPDIAHLFDAFVRNESVDESILKIYKIFREISEKGVSLREENLKVASLLHEMAREK